MKTLRLLLWLALGPAIVHTAVSQAATVQETLSEEWQIVTIEGARAGHASTIRTRRRGPDGRNRIETTTASKMAIKRMGMSIAVRSEMRTVEIEDGTPLRFSSRYEMSSQPTTSEGVIENGTLTLTTASGGVERTIEQKWDPECLLSEGVRLLMLRKGFDPGTKYSFKTWSAEQGKVDVVEIEVLKRESLDGVMGKRRDLTKMSMKTSSMPGIKTFAWVDAEGTAWVTEVNMLGLTVRTERTTKEEALRDAAAELPEVFVKTMPRSNVALPRPREITSLVVRLERSDGLLGEWHPPGGTQTEQAREGGSVTLRITSVPPERPATRPVAAGDDLRPFLKPSASVQSDDPDIRRKANEIVGDERDALKAARKLAGWVHEHIRKKSLDVAAASAKEVFRDGEGDCSEHAVLLTAMLRAAGIPAKVCGGYLYVRGMWGGHAWSSAWVGKWVDLDATLGDGLADAARIKFGETEASDAGGMMEGMSGAGFMHGDLKTEILEYTIDGKAVRVSRPGVLKGERFEAPLLGFSFEKPTEWSFKEAKDLPPFVLTVAVSPDGAAAVQVAYHDLPYDWMDFPVDKIARKLRARAGEEVEIAGRPAYEASNKIIVRLSAGEVLEFERIGGDAAAAALRRMRDTLKIHR
ncbi:MAG: transglutaminase domain-containing protein [Planctomycetes bacterium]|nr:transglutaminase domain-containing protein [Planctomycetota bacterium]